jgi:hypothetical protein
MISATQDAAILRHAVQTALACADSAWYCDTLRNDVCGCVLSKQEERLLVEGAVQTAGEMARQVVAKHGELPPDELAAAMRLEIVHVTEELRQPYLYMALYEPGTRTITVNDSAVTQVRQFIEANGLASFTPPDDILRIALFHEIFHAQEEETPGIYTRSRMVRRKALGIFPYARGLSGVAEVGAIHFSKCMAGAAYSPCIFERYLLLALDQLSIDFLPPSV